MTNEALLIARFTRSMFGSVPRKVTYCKCHGTLFGAVPSGSDSLLLSAHASPPVQGWPNVASLTAPVRAPLTFAMVPVWNESSSVTWHLIVVPPPENSSDVQVSLVLDSLTDRVL